MSLILSAIHIYPVKSFAGIPLSSADVEARGLQYDRRWMLVNDEGRFLTQRELPRMALISVAVCAGGLQFAALSREPLFVPFPTSGHPSLTVRVWRSECLALPVSGEADRWFTDCLGVSCRLVFMPDDIRRTVNPDYTTGEGIVSFADGYPLMILGEASLKDLNSRLEQPVLMNRFRPNLVFSGAPAFAEDDWKKLQIGTAVFHVVKPCDRCILTTINQETGEPTGPEPLKTLTSYRRRDQKVLFGQMLIPETLGRVHLGDTLEIL